MSLAEFKAAFIKYVAGIDMKMPQAFTDATDLELIAIINQYLRPFSHDMNLCYSNLQTLIIASGHEVPELTEEQKAKVKRFIAAFIKASE